MALTKTTSNDMISIVGEHKALEVRTATVVAEDGVDISTAYHRTSYMPDTDVATLDADVASIANIVWTQEVKDAYELATS